MIEAARLILEALLDATDGVNAKLVAMTTDDSDPTPAAFEAANIVELSSDARAALRRPDEADIDAADLYPALLITVPSVQWLDGEWAQIGDRIQARVTIEVRLALTEDDPAVAMRETNYRMKALEQSIRAFSRGQDMTVRRRNGVELSTLESVERLVVTNVPEDSLLTGVVRMVWAASDASPV